MSDFPTSLVNDRTKIGKQAELVHWHSDKERLFLSLDNGSLVLSKDGTWEWSVRTPEEMK